MLTRCPACATTFRVAPEQIKARAGKVRCGGCQAVFNALDTLMDEPPTPAARPPLRIPDVSAPRIVEPSAPPLAAEARRIPEVAASDVASGAPSSAPPGVTTAASVRMSAPTIAPQEAPTAEPLLTAPEEAPPAAAPWAALVTGAAAPPTAAAAAPERAAGRGMWRAALFAAAIGAASGTLLLQAAYQWRGELAVRLPVARPLLAAACEQIGCSIDLPTHAEHLAIEGSDLNPDPADASALVLAATLRNRADYAQAWPHLELTLTDTGNRALVRRVLAPADYLPAIAGASAALGIAAAGEAAFSLRLASAERAAAGYRLYLFYP